MKEKMKRRNIKFVLLVQLIVLVIAFLWEKVSNLGLHFDMRYFEDTPTFVGMLLIVVPGMTVLGEWKNFVKALSVGEKEYSLLELKNILEAVKAFQKLVLFAGVFEMFIGLVGMLVYLEDFVTMGPALAVALLPAFYTVIAEYFLLPLFINTQKAINEEMALDEKE